MKIIRQGCPGHMFLTSEYDEGTRKISIGNKCRNQVTIGIKHVFIVLKANHGAKPQQGILSCPFSPKPVQIALVLCCFWKHSIPQASALSNLTESVGAGPAYYICPDGSFGTLFDSQSDTGALAFTCPDSDEVYCNNYGQFACRQSSAKYHCTPVASSGFYAVLATQPSTNVFCDAIRGNSYAFMDGYYDEGIIGPDSLCSNGSFCQRADTGDPYGRKFPICWAPLRTAANSC